MPADKIFAKPAGNPPNPGTGQTVEGEVSLHFNTTTKEVQIYDGTTLYRLSSDSTETGAGAPKSGTSGTGAATFGVPGAVYTDSTNNVAYLNEGTLASPYWTPVSFDQPGLVGVHTDFSNKTGRLGSATTAYSYDNGLYYFGQGVEVNDADTAITISYPLSGPLATVGTTNEAEHLTALGYGFTAGLWKPSTNGTMVIDADFTGITDIATRTFFIGFSGDATGALASEIDPLIVGGTTTLTFSAVGTAGDNVAGLYMDSRMTAATTFFQPAVKANAAATETAAAAATSVATVMPVAATYIRLRVEIDTAGNMTTFANKAQIGTVALACTPTTALHPIFYQSNTTTTASLQMGVRRFGTWAVRG